MGSTVESASSKILHNSFWYGLETLIETVVFLGTSIAVARYLGPAKLGYFSYINFFVTVVTRTGGTGLANATRKYMSEYLALEQPGLARAVYHLAYRYQLLGALLMTVLGCAAVLLFGDPEVRLMSLLLVGSILPGVMSWVPANANQAFEDVSKNTFSAFCYIFTYTACILLTLHFRWGLVGIASALLVGRTIEVTVRTVPLHHRLKQFPLETLNYAATTRIRMFCLQAFMIQLLMSVVWDRSEMVFLRAFSSLEQIAFYSISFTLANNLLVVPRTFSGAAGVTLMVEASREPARVGSIVGNTARFLLLVVLPVNFGMASITRQVIALAYGAKYTGAVPVLVVAALLSIPRAFQEIAETLMRAADRQMRLLVWLGITGLVNIGLDFYLIPLYGALGAAWGNGLSQAFGIVVVWELGRRYFQYSFPIGTALRFTAAAALMAVAARSVAQSIPGIAGIALAIFTAIPVYFVAVKLVRAFEPTDRIRLFSLGNRLPDPLRKAYRATIVFATPAPAMGEWP